MTSTPSAPRGRTGVRTSPVCTSAPPPPPGVRAEHCSWPRRLLDVGKSSVINTLEHAKVGLSPFKSGYYGDAHGVRHGSAAVIYEGAAALTQQTQTTNPVPQIKYAHDFRLAGNCG